MGEDIAYPWGNLFRGIVFDMEGMGMIDRERELENALVQANAVLEAIAKIVYSDIEPDDFMMSFGLVREVYDLKRLTDDI